MKKHHIILPLLLAAAVVFLIFAGANGFWQEPEEENTYPYPISFLKIDAVETPDASYTIITLTEADKSVYPVLLSALEKGDTYLNIHPEGPMTPEEYSAVSSFAWESYVSFNGELYHVVIGPIGLAPPVPS